LNGSWRQLNRDFQMDCFGLLAVITKDKVLKETEIQQSTGTNAQKSLEMKKLSIL
jgi:hypothetical protein